MALAAQQNANNAHARRIHRKGIEADMLSPEFVLCASHHGGRAVVLSSRWTGPKTLGWLSEKPVSRTIKRRAGGVNRNIDAREKSCRAARVCP
jgi:hypothetical protein